VTATLLAQARAAGFRLELHGDRLVIHGPSERADLGRILREREDEIRDALRREADPWPVRVCTVDVTADGRLVSGPCEDVGPGHHPETYAAGTGARS
jgi:hypothetical protein